MQQHKTNTASKSTSCTVHLALSLCAPVRVCGVWACGVLVCWVDVLGAIFY